MKYYAALVTLLFAFATRAVHAQSSDDSFSGKSAAREERIKNDQRDRLMDQVEQLSTPTKDGGKSTKELKWEAESRIWTDSKGKTLGRYKFIEQKASIVTFEDESRKKCLFVFSRLSKKDGDWIKDELRARADLAKKTKKN